MLYLVRVCNPMGLDMYLYKRHYVWRDPEALTNIEGSVAKLLDIKKVRYITEEVLYWRKANHIHKRFVDNVQDGEDDCGEYEVDEEKLKELLALCKMVMVNKDQAEKLLPTADGFFFGGTYYDESYFKDLEDTIKGLEEALVEKEHDYPEYFYSSSW